MTANAAISHQEQMTAARAEFQSAWEEVKESAADLHCPTKNQSESYAEILAWRMFLKIKKLS